MCYLYQIINKVYDMLQVLPVKFDTLSNIQIVHYASNISCLKGGKVLFIQNMGEEHIVRLKGGTDLEYVITIGCLNSHQLVA